MFQRLIRIWEFLSHTLWLVPLLFGVGGALLAVIAIVAPGDHFAQSLPDFWPRFSNAGQVQTLTSNLLTGLVTMVTFALSVTMVVLTLAAQSLGPRTIRNFMGDEKTQTALGIFVGSILFLITALVMMGAGSSEDKAPQIAAIGGVALFVICLFDLILFVSHLGRSIVADQIIERVGDNLEQTIAMSKDRLEQAIEAARDNQVQPGVRANINPDRALCAPRSGFVQGIAYDKLTAYARACDMHITLIVRPGQHIIKGEVIGEISTTSKDKPSTTPLDDRRFDEITAQVLIGNQRTATMDIEFALRQLVEIALRALSPGINDPFTAIACLYRLGRALPGAMTFHYPVGVWQDEDGAARLSARIADFGTMQAAAFDQIRHAARDKADVLIAMAQIIESLIALAQTPRQRKMLSDQAQCIARSAQNHILEPRDRSRVEQAIGRALRANQS